MIRETLVVLAALAERGIATVRYDTRGIAALAADRQKSQSEAYAKLSAPTLIVQGDADIQVPVAEAEALHAARKGSELFVVPRMSHTFNAAGDDPASQMKGYTESAVPIVPALAPRIARFLAPAT